MLFYLLVQAPVLNPTSGMVSPWIMGSQAGTPMQQQMSRRSQMPLLPSLVSKELLSPPRRQLSHMMPPQLPVSSYIH